MIRRAVPIVLGVCLLAAAPPAAAKFCGDDVQGQDVSCACGDIVVSNVTLSNDPVAAAECDGDALVLRATEATAGLTLDLNGKTLHGGKHGAGIWVVDGGPGGARIVSSAGQAAIVGFRDGIVARGDRSIALVEKIDVRGCERDGLRLNGGNYEVRSVEISGAGRDGISLAGHDYRCNSTRAVRSGRFGYFIGGRNGVIGVVHGGNTADDSGSDGFHMTGSSLRLNLCVSTGNRRDGVSVHGSRHEVTGCAARNNGEDGIAGEGGNVKFYANRAEDNGRNGIRITGVHLFDGGGNRSSGNRGEGLHAAVQCEIGGVPCRP